MMCKRKLASAVAAAAMLVAIAGCGGAKPARSGTTAPGTAPPDHTSQPTAPPTAVPNGPGPLPATVAAAATPAGGTNSQPVAPPSRPVSEPAAPATQPVSQPTGPPSEAAKQPPAQPSTPPPPQPTAPVNPVSPTPPAPPATTPPPSQSGSLTFTTIARGQQSGGHDRGAVLVQDEATLNAQGIRPQQTVNFSQESVLVIYMGEQNTGGYSVDITSVKLEGGKLLVTVKQSRPSPNSMVTQALTQPYHAVKLPKVPAGTQVSVNWL